MSKLSYLIKRISTMNLNGLKKRVKQVRKITGKSSLTILLDMAVCAVRYEAGYIDYTIFGMYDMTHEQRKDILTRGKNTKYVQALNRKEYCHFFNNKSEFLTLFAEEVGREFLDLNHATPDDFLEFAHKHLIIMVKPEAGLCGKNIEKIDTDDYDSCVTLYNTLKTGGQTLIEEVLEQHDKVNKLYDGAVNTVRMVTMLDNEGEPHLLYAAMRLGSGGAVVDNFNSGGMVIPIDLEKGKLMGVAVNKKGEAFEKHPDTGISFNGYQLPDWKKCCTLASKAAVKVPGVRLVGWDLALTPKGPVLVEGNHYPGHDIYQLVAQNPDKKGMLPVFDAVVPYESLKKRK
ncbi:MAG: hypothetical protein IJ407_05630 [Clostridia bacterium]|nr:hypothetical protein [Clostridia bacterium]